MQGGGNVNIKNNCLVCGKVMSLINPLERVVIVRIVIPYQNRTFLLYSCYKEWNVKQIRYQFWCTRCAFRLLKSHQWYLGRKKVGSPKIVGKSRKYQILCREIEPNPSKDRSMHEGDNPSFLNESILYYTFGQFTSRTCSDKLYK
jgi:hypothetical protein